MIAVRITKLFDGPRHERLYNIWEAIAEYCQEYMVLRWYNNLKGLNHASALNAIWQEEREFDQTRLILTEHDFLPDLTYNDWLLQKDFDDTPNIGAIGPSYAKRKSGSHILKNFENVMGAWFLSLDKERCPETINFHGRVDPCTDLIKYLSAYGVQCVTYFGEDPHPLHFGVEYPFGTHLFWSRHYNDDPNIRLSGISLRESLTKHDRTVTSWIVQQPQNFQTLLSKRFGSGILGSSSEYIDARSFFYELGGKSENLNSVALPVSPSSFQ